MRNSSTTALPATSRPALSEASTSATAPPIITRYLPRGTIVVRSSSTLARFIMASVASMPLAMELVSRSAMAGPRLDKAFPFMVAMDGAYVRPRERSTATPLTGRGTRPIVAR